MPDTRTESDSFGPIEVPAQAYWGAQTQRSIENFPFGPEERMPTGIVHALAIVKQAAARINRGHGLDATLAAHAEFGHDGTVVCASDRFRHLQRDVIELTAIDDWPLDPAPVA